MSGFVQLVGVLLLVVAGFILWSPWALVVGGAVLLAAPEVGAAFRRSRR